MVDRIVVTHQNDGGRIVALAESPDQIKGTGKRHACFERALTRQLDCRTICHRVGERHAKFDDVDACGWQALDDFKRGLGIRIARHNE